ncbi:MAG: hypothetical protein EOO06_14965 [Chitinophagaceae bacterium]|nr:MAG: hypothetical protein EOO06_14965 [Chitinophagaceae bacterium]
MEKNLLETKIRTLINHAWDSEVTWAEIEAWLNNFDGSLFDKTEEQLYAIFAISRYMYFGKRLVREMLKSLYRDHFYAPMRQRIRRNFNGTFDQQIIENAYRAELSATRFIGVGNPSESGAHLLYYFRQVNYLPKDLFVDLAAALTYQVSRDGSEILYDVREKRVTRLVFFDDIVGSGTQASEYLTPYLSGIKASNPSIDIRFMSLFATTAGLAKLNESKLFDGEAMCLFELDDSFKAFDPDSRYFSTSPIWFDKQKMFELTEDYGKKLWPAHPFGYKNGQLLISFSHNTPDNVPPIFWALGGVTPWAPAFVRYHKQ